MRNTAPTTVNHREHLTISKEEREPILLGRNESPQGSRLPSGYGFIASTISGPVVYLIDGLRERDVRKKTKEEEEVAKKKEDSGTNEKLEELKEGTAKLMERIVKLEKHMAKRDERIAKVTKDYARIDKKMAKLEKSERKTGRG
jgi:uncharacterized membrane-anchored protein YhcB (DUF1043 family)